MTPDLLTPAATAGSLLLGALSGWLAHRRFARERRADEVAAAAAVFQHGNQLTQILLNERSDREAAIARLEEKVARLGEELSRRGERIERMEADNLALWTYLGQLESLIRGAGLSLPPRPALNETPAYLAGR